MTEEGMWVSILEYAAFKKTSISTVRRHIKANRVKHKKEDGKFFIYVATDKVKLEKDQEKRELELMLENNALKQALSKRDEEINDLKMLISIYENKKSTHLPELPLE